MHCVVTAGPTFEPLDEVRRLTNFSTGGLGSSLANFLVERGHHVTLLLGQQATWHGAQRAQRLDVFTTTSDLHQRLHALAGSPVDALFHTAAVSDFAFGTCWERSPEGQLQALKAGKISTRLGGTLLVELRPTAKIIRELRSWFAHACIVGWKFEVDGSTADALAKARQQIAECQSDACVANGRAYGPGFGLVSKAGACLHLKTMDGLFLALEDLLRGRRSRGPGAS